MVYSVTRVLEFHERETCILIYKFQTKSWKPVPSVDAFGAALDFGIAFGISQGDVPAKIQIIYNFLRFQIEESVLHILI